MNFPFCNAISIRAASFSFLAAVALAACGHGDPLNANDAPVAGQLSTNAANTTAASTTTTDAPSLEAAIWGLHQPRPGLYTAGQPDSTSWQVAAGNGITTVINLRPVAEMGDRDEAAEVAAAGMEYHQLPVAGADDITMDNAIELRRLVDQASGPVLVHCASGNRVGALLALGEVESGAVAAGQALAFGRSAGLGSLEPRVREVIENTHADACKADASC